MSGVRKMGIFLQPCRQPTAKPPLVSILHIFIEFIGTTLTISGNAMYEKNVCTECPRINVTVCMAGHE